MSRQIVLAADVAADAGAAFETVTTEHGLTSFWTSDVTASPEIGSLLRFGFEPAPVDLELTLQATEPGASVVWHAGDNWPDWAGTRMTWSFGAAPDGAMTRVVFVHDGWADDYADGELGSVAYTWALVLGALKGYLETGAAQPALG